MRSHCRHTHREPEETDHVSCCMRNVGYSWCSDDQNSHQRHDVRIICFTSCAFLFRYGGTGCHAADPRTSSGTLAGRHIVGIACSIFRGDSVEQLRVAIRRRSGSEWLFRTTVNPKFYPSRERLKILNARSRCCSWLLVPCIGH